MATAFNPAPSKPPVRYRLRFVVEHEPWLKTFLRNLTDLFRRPLPPLPVTSQPGQYWADAWVDRPIAWMSMGRSLLIHLLAVAAIYGLGLVWPGQPQVVRLSRTISDFQITPYLPPVNSRPEKKTAPVREHAQKADPTYAPQEIISIQPDHNSTQQTIIQPTLKVLNQDVALPNMVIWTPIPSPAPVAPRTMMSQYVPSGAPQVVPPTTQAAKRALSTLQFGERPQVVAPPSPIAANHLLTVPEGVVAVIPPVADPVKRPLSNLDFPGQSGSVSGSASAVAPASPAAQRDVRNLPALGQGQQQAIAPAAPVASGTGNTQGQQMGQLLALNAHPSAPNGPVTVPEGNRRGEFAAGPDGRPGASGKPEFKQGTSAPAGGPGSGGGPAGVYVSAPPGNATGTTGNVVVSAPVKATPKPAPTSRADSPTSKDNTGRDTKNGRIEENVFSGRRYYSMLLSMPNLNSGGGSWTIRFAELNPDVLHHSEENLTGPMAISKVDPAYPLELMSDRVEGTVVLYAVIHSDGSVGEVRVLEGVESQLDENAMVALKRWRFRPGHRGDVPVDVEAVVHIPFRVPRNAPRNAY